MLNKMRELSNNTRLAIGSTLELVTIIFLYVMCVILKMSINALEGIIFFIISITGFMFVVSAIVKRKIDTYK